MTEFNSIVQFIREKFQCPNGDIQLHTPFFNGNEKKYIEDCIDSTFVSSVGKYVSEFERKVESYTGAASAVVCVNGTNALHLGLKLLGVEIDDEVITQPLTFIATANAISYCGAKPIFLDVDSDTMGLSPIALKRFLENNTKIKGGNCFNLSTNRRIKACVPMHTFGHPCRIDEIVSICSQFHIDVIEDAAESIGSLYKGKHTGTFGKIGVLSFNGNKTITTGGGGMLIFNGKELGEKAKHLTTQAKVKHPYEFIHDEIGYNYRMPNINAALGVAQMEQLNYIIDRKRLLADSYSKYFSMIGINFFHEPIHAKSNYWLNAILLDNRLIRDEFLDYTNKNGIYTRPIWRLMNKLPMFQNCQTEDISNAINLENCVVNLPSSVIM